MSKSAKGGLILILAISAAGGLLIHQKLRGQSAEQALEVIAPQIVAVTIYDIQRDDADAKTLTSAASASFPVEVFRHACAGADHQIGPTIWKGSSLAVLTLRDGSRRRARFSYYGGFFALQGVAGRFAVQGGGSSEFQRLHHRLIQEEFVPKRPGQNKAWKYQYEVLLPGTRSEHVNGSLLFNGSPLPGELKHVITPIGEFLFQPAKGPGGVAVKWLPVRIDELGNFASGTRESEVKELLSGKGTALRVTKVKAKGTVSSEAALSGSLEQPPEGVGSDWFYMVESGRWINPGKLDEALKEKPKSTAQ